MATQAIPAYGTLFKKGDGAGSESFTTIAEVINISGLKLKSDTKDATSHSSPSAFKEFIVTVIDGGEVSLDIQYVPTAATHGNTNGIIADIVNRTKRNVKIVWPDANSTTWTAAGYFTGFDVKAPVEDKLTATVTYKVTGLPTLI